MKQKYCRNVYYNEGNRNDFAFVFSAPGKKELINEKPISGSTGDNLEVILDILEIECKDRYDFRITNAYPYKLFQKEDGRSEAKISEILVPENINRLKNELNDIKSNIIFFGDRAKSTAIYLPKLDANFIFCPHLSFLSVNHIKTDLLPNEDVIDKNKLRLKAIAELIRHQLK